jgi:hypothetical protein
MEYPLIAEDDAAQMQVEWGEWKPIPRVSKQIPFGYKVSEEDPDTLLPIELELEALEKAKLYKDRGHSLRDIANWIEQVTGRKISHSGLDKRIKSDSKRRARAKTLRIWASRYKEAIQKAYDWDQKHTACPEEFYKKLLDPDFDPGAFTKGLYGRS